MRKVVFVALPFLLFFLVIISSGCGGGSAAASNSHAATPNSPASAPTATLAATPSSVPAGAPLSLIWSAEGATSVTIDNGIGAVSSSPITIKAPSVTTTYTLTATNSAGTTTATARVNVLPTVSFTASPATIVAGAASTLSWNTQGATTVAIDNGIGPVGLASSTEHPVTVSPGVTTTYTLTATNNAGATTATVTVTVKPDTSSKPPTVTAFTASPTMISNGASTTLNWNTQGAATVTIDNGVGNVGSTGPVAVSPTDTTTYTLTATNSAGSTTATVKVTVAQSGIQHLIVVMMQNSSFDHLFGTYPNANGLDPTLPSYKQVDQAGNTVTPQVLTNYSPPDVNHTRKTYLAAWDNGKMDKYAYTNGDMSMDYYDSSSNVVINGSTYGVGTLWHYANNYALADNFFASAMASEPANILYMVSASVGNGTTNAFGLPELDGCTAEVAAKTPTASISPPLTYPNVGDQLSDKGISWAWYQENFANEQNGTCTSYIPQENAFQYFESTANKSHVLNYSTSAFQTLLSNGTLPAVAWVQPAPTHDMHPGSGSIGNSVLWLDNFINSVKSSSAWPNTAIIVLWDESGGWYDHVAPPQISGTLGLGARVPVLVISPFAKANYISHEQMDFVSILRFIQANWNLGKFAAADQAAREDQSGDICDLLTVNCSQP